MEKNNGFIATSLLYSFFLIFCAILLSLVGTFLHNRILHNNTIDSIKENLSNVGKITLANAEIGNYVKMPIFTSGITININDVNWIISSANSDTTTLVSSDIINMTNIKEISLLQANIDRFFNMYTTGSTSQNYMTYFTKELIDDFELLDDVILKKSLLSNDDEYIYYDEINGDFYLYQYTCDINDECTSINTPIGTSDLTQYGLRLVMTVSSITPVTAGMGVLNNPYEVLYYTQDSFLVLHYDNLNNSRNKGIISGNNYLKDLTGINPDGILDDGTYQNDQTEGITIPSSKTINTNLNIYDIINSPNGYTIEFRAKNYLTLGSNPDYLINFIMLNTNPELLIYETNVQTELTTGSFNTISLVKKTTEPNKLKIYINGVFLQDTPKLVSSENNILYIGGSAFTEIFKSIRVYNTALTDAEIIHNYNVDMRWNN